MENIRLSSSPHIFSASNVSRIMLDVIIALVPAAVAGCIFFGLYPLAIIAVSVASAIAAEAVLQRLTKKKVTIKDCSAAVTGLLLGLNLAPTVPLWIPAVGAAFAIVVVKQVFGGLGHNFMNPALAARAVLQISWPSYMTNWISPSGVDAVTSATPLALIKPGAEAVSSAAASLPSYLDMFLGNIGGCIGETSALALLLGGVYLMIRKVIIPVIPAAFIGTVALFTFVAGPKGLFTGDALYHILAGGLFIGAFFMATDYASSPVSIRAQLVYGIGCGVITSVIRLYGGYPEGVSFSILLMNLAAPLLDRAFRPRVYGEVSKK